MARARAAMSMLASSRNDKEMVRSNFNESSSDTIFPQACTVTPHCRQASRTRLPSDPEKRADGIPKVETTSALAAVLKSTLLSG